MRKPIRIALAEDHELVRQGMVSLLNEEPEIKIVFDVANGEELLKKVRKSRIDVIILDLEMPIISGHQALRILNDRYPDIKVIILSMHYTNEFIAECISNGARGFLPKYTDFDKVVDAIYAVHVQGYYFDDKVSKTLLKRLIDKNDINPIFPEDPLTKREVQIIQLICAEKLNREIADLLCISVRTVEVHRKKILNKTGSKNIAGLVIFAVKNGLYNLDY